jgi:uncharacterized membrane protein (Fun14 family)
MQDQATSVSSPFSFLDNLKNFDLRNFIEKIKQYELDWTEIGITLSIGILSGFLFKRYLKSFVALVICGVIVLGLLEHYGIIMLDWTRVHALTGVEPTQEAALNFLEHCWLWVQINKVPSISCVVGFFVGVKLG